MRSGYVPAVCSRITASGTVAGLCAWLGTAGLAKARGAYLWRECSDTMHLCVSALLLLSHLQEGNIVSIFQDWQTMSSTLDFLDKASIAIVAVWSFIFLLSLGLCCRRNHGRFLPWIFLCFFAIIHLVGAALQLSASHTLTPKALKLYVGARLCTWIGPQPLFLAVLFWVGNTFRAMRSRHPWHRPTTKSFLPRL